MQKLNCHTHNGTQLKIHAVVTVVKLRTNIGVFQILIRGLVFLQISKWWGSESHH